MVGSGTLCVTPESWTGLARLSWVLYIMLRSVFWPTSCCFLLASSSLASPGPCLLSFPSKARMITYDCNNTSQAQHIVPSLYGGGLNSASKLLIVTSEPSSLGEFQAACAATVRN